MFDDAVVVEIGASVPERTRQLSTRCKKLIGVEYIKERIPPESGNITYLNADWQQLTTALGPESADLVISSHVIEHVEDDLTAINEVYAVLKPGGVALINTPNRMRLIQAAVAIIKGPRKFPDWEHVREYTSDDLETLLRLSRFRGSFRITPVVFGLSNRYIGVYFRNVPRLVARWANYWEVVLTKASSGS